MTAKDAFYLMMMCPFETVYRREYSPFCMMFSEEEFEGFEYALDLEQYYTTGLDIFSSLPEPLLTAIFVCDQIWSGPGSWPNSGCRLC